MLKTRNKITLEDITSKYKMHPEDCGSAAVQVCQYTEEIINISGHLQENKKDESCKRGLMKIINKRKKLLIYLKREDKDKYLSLIADLELKDKF